MMGQGNRVQETAGSLSFRLFLSMFILIVLAMLLLHAPATQAETPLAAEAIRLGERMYREGILPSGDIMPAFIRGDVEVDSTAFSCSSCHLRAGLGSVEGGVVTPPTTGAKLYKPYKRPPSLGDRYDKSGRAIYAKTIIQRPAYDRTTLAKALRFGVDPAGEQFNDVMPRYPLSDRDMDVLINYLESLSRDPSPAISTISTSFATIVTEEVSQEDRQALLGPLKNFISYNNSQCDLFSDFLKFGYNPTVDMKYAFRRASLDIWELKGPPETWKAQLAEYYRSKPVFAVLGGISTRDWKPIHEFCESERLPCFFPITNFPATSEAGWYTWYFNKGYTQEGEAAARFIGTGSTATDIGPILQIVTDSPAGRVLADGFDAAWKELGNTAVPRAILTADQARSASRVVAEIARHKPRTLVLWSDASLLPLLKEIIASPDAPARIIVSSTLLGAQTISIPDQARKSVYITFPYRITPYVGPRNSGYKAPVPTLITSRDLSDSRITSRTVTMLNEVLLRGMSLLYENLYRDYLLDLMDMQPDLVTIDFERLSFGPGQRFASKGCYIIQLGPGSDPMLIPRSEWVIH